MTQIGVVTVCLLLVIYLFPCYFLVIYQDFLLYIYIVNKRKEGTTIVYKKYTREPPNLEKKKFKKPTKLKNKQTMMC